MLEYIIGLHIATAHIDQDFPMNGANPGIYVQANNIVAGTYYNSLYKQTYYAGYMLEHSRFALTLGVANGYEQGLTPMVIPSTRFNVGELLRLRVTYLPKINATASHVVHFSIEKEFK